MRKGNPTISVVMPVYNAEKYVREAIESILNQTFENFEFIIIDDGSIDGSAEIVKSYKDPRVIVIQQENKGNPVARNAGNGIAEGKYIASMDADDISHPNRLSKQFDYMENHKTCVALATDGIIIDEQGNRICSSKNTLTEEELRKQLPERNPFTHGSMMIRKDVLSMCGGYKELRNGSDILLWIDLQKHGELHILDESLYYYRITPGSVDSNSSKKLSRELVELSINYYDTGKISRNDLLAVERVRNSIENNESKGKSHYHLRVGKAYLEHTRNLLVARRHLLDSVKCEITNWNAWFNLLLSFCPRTVIDGWKKLRIPNYSSLY